MPIFKRGKPFSRNTIMSLVSKSLTEEVSIGRPGLHSDAGYCARRSSLVTNLPDGYTSIQGAASQFYFSTGTALHETIQRGMKKAGILVAAEYRIERLDLDLGGIIDAICMVDDQITIVEIKSCGSLPSSPKPEHKSQALTYSLMTGIRKIVILYVSRKIADYTGNIISTEFNLTPDEDELMTVAVQLYRSKFYSKAHFLAPVPAHIQSENQCGFCNFIGVCWGSEPSPIGMATSEKRLEIDEIVKENAQKLVESLINGESERYDRLLTALDLV